MSRESYGVIDRAQGGETVELAFEELQIRGFTVVPDVLNDRELEAARARLDEVYQRQEEEVGRECLAAINELDTARCPLVYDDLFLELAGNSTIGSLAHRVIGGGYVILMQQNGILNTAQREHDQTAWHRDLPYQHFVSSQPLAVTALYCLDDFNEQTGGTRVLPHSHRFDTMPSPEYCAKHEEGIVADAGSVIVMDSMLFHRAGVNRSSQVRRGINQIYCIPLLKQPIDLAPALEGKNAPEALRRLLDAGGGAAPSAVEYRRSRFEKVAGRRGAVAVGDS